MNVRIEDSFDPITEDELVTFEQEFGIRLPSDYRRFLLAHNGGKPNPMIFDVEIDGLIVRDAVDRFLVINTNESDTFPQFLGIYGKRLPKSFLPIATNISVDLICLSVDGDDYGKIYYWDHNFEVTEGEPDYSNVYLIADSFTEFLDMLRNLDEDE